MIKNISKLEFWIATGIYFITMLVLITAITNPDNNPYNHQHFYLPKIFRYSILYFSFLLLNFCVVPTLVQGRNIALNIGLIILTLFASGMVYSITDTYIKSYLLYNYSNQHDAYVFIFISGFAFAAWMIMLLGIYTGIKKGIIYLIENKELLSAQHNSIKIEGAIAASIWLLVLIMLIVTNGPIELIALWAFMVPFSIGTILYSIYILIPQLRAQSKPFKTYFVRMLFITLLFSIPLAFIVYLIFARGEAMAVVTGFNVPFQLIICAPLAWHIYKKRSANTAELTHLKTALGRSTADLGFLRSQINPHFLFNALNTLYGTALQEEASRTSEGIQKLGDMMRFMLQENMQEKILLTREIDYLNNYIDLQKLRTQTSESIVIQTKISEHLEALQIAPMLLIPFVENAFKHGISLIEPSHIKITLHVNNDSLYFDVNNSIHIKNDFDPEKTKSGIGLANVKQRLALLYPQAHELIIRETGTEYFIHLTIKLDK